MESYPLDHFIITLDKEGSREFSKVSFPMRHGRFAEIRTPEYLFQFNLNGEIKFIQGLTRTWPHPAEWLKRTMGNDWVYYSAGDYKGIYDYFGEYYFPYLSYPSNSIMEGDPFGDPSIILAKNSLRGLRATLDQLISGTQPKRLKDFLTRVIENDEETLRRRADQLHCLIGGRATVLPPDTRHVDYEVIPIIVADGCLYHCGFCRVKTGQDFVPRTAQDVVRQMKEVKRFLGRDLHNYSAVFLGQHDALSAGRGLLEAAAEGAYEIFEFERSHLRGASLFLFGSVDSMIRSEEGLFESLSRLPFSTYINVGLESNDPKTLEALKKPVSVEKIQEAFTRMSDINRRYGKIEVTSNFVIGEDLPSAHLPSLLELTRNRVNLTSHKGAIYLSPLVDDGMGEKEGKRELLRRFLKLKAESRLPAFIYLIQRL
ncbi:MAG TPA: radical SAM protein [Thermodesulfobacteriota bacterium]|nr:radical SAM protein [Thermodesulfobacteriota bacterium]